MQDPNHEPPAIGSIAAIVPAAGSGHRFGGVSNKLFSTIAGKPLWVHAVERLRDQILVGRIVIPIAESDLEYFSVQNADTINALELECVIGGAERSDSVLAGLNLLQGDDSVRWVAVHDAARPLVSRDDLASVFATATRTGAAILASPVTGTVRRDISTANDPGRTEMVDRRHLYVALTPQVFDAGLLRQAYAKHNGRPATDDAELVQRIGHPVSLVRGSADNIKITYPEDLAVAEAILTQQQLAHQKQLDQPNAAKDA